MIKKTYYLFRIFEHEGKLDNYTECSYLSSDTLEDLKRQLIKEELFHYECFPEEWEEMEEKIGMKRKEMLGMDFMDILDKLHKEYFLVAEYHHSESGSYGPAIPYND